MTASAALHACGELRAVGDVAFEQLGAEVRERLRLLGRADESRHLVASLAQLAHHVTADESGSPGDEDLHAPKPILNLCGQEDDG